jgi:hypothetical protein
VKFRESQALDLASGTALNIAYCEMELGHTASAWLAYRQAISLAQQQGKPLHERLAREQAVELEPRVPHLLLVVPRSEGAALDIELDGRPVTSDMWSVPLPVDPGLHRVAASMDGKQVWNKEVKLGAGERVTVEVTPSPSHAQSPATEPRIRPGADAPSPQRMPERESTSSRDTQLAIVFGGASVVSLGFGAYFGGRAISQGNSVAKACTGDVCSSRVKGAYDDGRVDAWRANVLIGTSLVAAAVSVYFLVRSSTRRSSGWRAGRRDGVPGHRGPRRQTLHGRRR